MSGGFAVTGPLPTGTTVLEASAGTGKTWTIAALTARYVAEGHATLPEIMLVTFGRAATRELRERVRERLVGVERALADPAGARTHEDAVIRHLAAAADDECAGRRRRVAHALAHFDAATIATTHVFCQAMLDGLGISADTDPDATFVEQVGDVLGEVVDDFYVRAYAVPAAGEPEFGRVLAGTLAADAVGDPEAVVEPAEGAAEGTAAERRGRFARGVRAELERRKRRARLYTFDDMVTRLHRVLRDPVGGPAARERVRSRYRVVLVDEFQDTDLLQWQILEAAFAGHTTLILIGDPKQAIYAFRGADVHSYLRARAQADTVATLDTNFRSDRGVVLGTDVLLGRAALGEGITVGEVAADRRGSRLAGVPVPAPVRLRVVPRAGLALNRAGLAQMNPARRRVAHDLAADVSALLAAKSTWAGEPLEPGHVAVLVRSHTQAELVRAALTEAGVPVVVGTPTSVFATEGAAAWLTLLEAVERPGSAVRVRAAALCDLVGRRAAELDADADAVLGATGEMLRRTGAVLRDHGVAAFQEAVATRTGLLERMLATTGGERRLTDIRHVGQVLHTEAAAGRLGVTALVEWLRLRIAEARAGTVEPRPERTRRLESDADAVQIHTVHKCKGLEFPVVYVPFGWDRWVPDRPETVQHHDRGPQGEDRRILAVGGPSDPRWSEHTALAAREEFSEDLRLLYVAMTRAQGQLVLWWAPGGNAPRSPLHRLLLGRVGAGVEPPDEVPVPDDDAAARALIALAGTAQGAVVPERVEDRAAVPFMPGARTVGIPAASTFDRRLDRDWRRASYSSLTALAHEAPAATSEPEDDVQDDEAEVDVVEGVGGVGDASDAARPGTGPGPLLSPMADLPSGTAFGTLVHAVLETVDLPAAAEDPAAAVDRAVAAELGRRPMTGVDPDTLGPAVVAVLTTPLGPGWALRDVPSGSRLAELGFELPLVGGDTPRPRAAAVTLAGVADLVRRHLPADDVLAAYPDALAGLAGSALRGYLTGSVDAVLRRPDGRFVVVDYKTNWLGPIGPAGADPLTTAHYAPARLVPAMVRAHYPLQALLYGVALHRFLRWRLRGYDPDRHLGGSLYLFLRGMAGPTTPVVDGHACGVFAWEPPPTLTAALSDLLDGAPTVGPDAVGPAVAGRAS